MCANAVAKQWHKVSHFVPLSAHSLCYFRRETRQIVLRRGTCSAVAHELETLYKWIWVCASEVPSLKKPSEARLRPER